MSGPPTRNDLSIYGARVDAWWDHDDPIFAPLHAMAPARLAYFKRVAEPWAGQAVLDVGCGGGYVSEALAGLGAAVTGVDIAEGAITAAREHAAAQGLNITYLVSSADTLPFEDSSFDRVVCTDVLVHVPDPAPVILEVGRVLKPGGIFVFSSINRSWLSRLVMIHLGEDLLGLVYKGTHDPNKFIKPAELAAMSADAGLQVRGFEGIGPRWIGLDGGLRFGALPSLAVMYQGHAIRPGQLPAAR